MAGEVPDYAPVAAGDGPGGPGSGQPGGPERSGDGRGGPRPPVLVALGVLAVVAALAGALVLRRTSGRVVAPPAGCRAVGPLAAPAAPADPKPPAPRRGGTLVVAVDRETAGFDPTTDGWTESSFLVASAVFEPLAQLDDAGNVEGVAAERIEASDDHRVFTIQLHPGIRFSDGLPYDAEAVRANFVANQANKVTGPAYAPIRKVVVWGPRTLSVEMDAPWPAFPGALAGQLGFVLSPGLIGSPLAHTRPVGAGPYVIQRWEPGEAVLLTRNPSWWREASDGPPRLDAIQVRVIPDAVERRAAFVRGEVDIAFGTADDPAADAAATVAVGGRARAAHRRVTAVVLNTSRPPLDDVRVRRALAHAVDRHALVAATGRPGVVPVASPFPLESPWCTDADGHLDTDPDAARQLLEDHQAGGGSALRIELRTGASLAESRLAEALARMWRAVGVTVDTHATDQTRAVLSYVNGHYDAGVVDQIVPGDPDIMLDWFHTDDARGPGQPRERDGNENSLNLSRLRDRAVDQLVEDLRRHHDPVERRGLTARLNRELNETVPYVWLYAEPQVMMVSGRVLGAEGLLAERRPSERPWAAGAALSG